MTVPSKIQSHLRFQRAVADIDIVLSTELQVWFVRISLHTVEKPFGSGYLVRVLRVN